MVPLESIHKTIGHVVPLGNIHSDIGHMVSLDDISHMMPHEAIVHEILTCVGGSTSGLCGATG